MRPPSLGHGRTTPAVADADLGYIHQRYDWANHLKTQAWPALTLSDSHTAQECDAEATAISDDLARVSEESPLTSGRVDCRKDRPGGTPNATWESKRFMQLPHGKQKTSPRQYCARWYPRRKGVGQTGLFAMVRQPNGDMSDEPTRFGMEVN